MKKNFDRTEKALGKLAQKVTSGEVPKADELWGGAHILILTESLAAQRHHEPGDIHLVTPFASEVSWLFEEVRKAFKGLICFQNKFEVYGRLALIAGRHLKEHSDADLKALLLTVLAEGAQILTEMRKGEFRYLIATVDNTLAVELKEDHAT